MSRFARITSHFVQRSLFNEIVRKNAWNVTRASRRWYALKYVDPRKFDIADVKVIHDEDPLSVKILEKHGKAWHIMNEGRNGSIAHTISGDFDMNNGLVREFSLHFENLQNDLIGKESPLGSVVAINNGKHYIYLLVIRENWWDRGAYRPMRESLIAMRDHALKNNVKTIAMGRLGGQDDGLDFREVLIDIKKVFYDTGLTLTMYFRRT